MQNSNNDGSSLLIFNPLDFLILLLPITKEEYISSTSSNISLKAFINNAAKIIIALACAVLIGWQFNISILKSIVPGLVAMNPFTALGFIAISVWQILQLRKNDTGSESHRVISFALGLLVFIMGFVRLLDIIAGTNFSPDDLLYASQIGNGRIAPLSAFSFCMCGLTMLFCRAGLWKNMVLIFMIPVFIVSIISLFGYLIGINDILVMRPFVPMALPTTLCFLGLVVSFLFLFPQNVFTRIIKSKDSGGYTARRLLPFIVFVPLILGFLRYHGERLGFYNSGFGIAMLLVGAMFIFIIVVLRQSKELSKIDHYRKKAETKVQLRTEEVIKANAELNLKNKELEQFTYAASHDMQEPLRKVQVYSSILLHHNADKLDENSVRHLNKIDVSVTRMKTIIDDLLKYSHQTREDQLFVGTDLNLIIENIESDLELVIQQKKAVIKKEILPSVNVVPSQVHQLFYNLISNALKFSKPGVIPQIEIDNGTGKDEEIIKQLITGKSKQYVHICVSDNGIGFEQQYAEQIFSLFSRLHNKNDYEGTGIGLALCKKIVENHEGNIWTKSTPGEGSTFHVLLPR